MGGVKSTDVASLRPACRQGRVGDQIIRNCGLKNQLAILKKKTIPDTFSDPKIKTPMGFDCYSAF